MLPTSPANVFALVLTLKKPNTKQDNPIVINKGKLDSFTGKMEKLPMATKAYNTVMPLIPSIKLKALIHPIKKIIRRGNNKKGFWKSCKSEAINKTAIIWQPKRGNVGKGFTSSTKLRTATKITAKVTAQPTYPNKKAIRIAIGKIIPPPLRVMLEWDER